MKRRGRELHRFLPARRPVFSSFFSALLLVALSGCLDCERASISIDLVHRVAEVRYFNIVSGSREEETVREDFRDLINKVYFEEEPAEDPDRITSRRLFGNKDQLDGRVRFAFRSSTKVLKEYGIETDKDGDYILDLTKESENYQVSSNGRWVESGSRKILKWPKTVEKIEFEQKNKVFDEMGKTRLLSHWQAWMDRNTKK